MVLLVDSSGWATRLRFAEQQIVDLALRRANLYVSKVKIRVDPPSCDVEPEHRRLSHSAAHHLQLASRSIPDRDISRLFAAIAKTAAERTDCD